MTTIDEENMDEFFNFEEATTPLHQDVDFPLSSESFEFDLDLQSGDSFFPDPNSTLNLQHAFHADTTSMGPDDFTDFPRWIDGMVVPTQSCAYCRRMRIHCKVIKEGLRKGSCTSCVALARSCSLTHPGPRVDDGLRRTSESFGQPGTFGLPGNIGLPGEDLAEHDGMDLPQLTECCDVCQRRGLVCERVKRGGKSGEYVTCVDADTPCSLASQNYQGGYPTEKNSTPTTPLEETFGSSTPNFNSRTSSVENINALGGSSKVGARFSRESNRILRSWLSAHHQNPYPNDDEKDTLMKQTGLNKTQITNWLANARRRGKVRPPRSTSPSVNNYANAMDIPRRATPALEHMNPLERWKNSPPENEPASVTAIAKAVSTSTFSSGRDSPHTSFDDGSNRSICNVSSASSLGTSHGTSHSSGGSFASAFSHKSQGSFGSFGTRGRRRRRRAPPKQVKADPMKSAAKTYQCTFCTETFKTKHDWQRHEKSLHLSLERWVCCPDGPTQFCADYGHKRCVFCALPNPPIDHAEVHNYSSCADRALEERTFYRKDHLRQHLNLVHDVKFQSFSMDSWQVTTPEIRSRCGFCGIVLDSWGIRVDHLAEHFKGGKSMADWKGDWGFEPQVLDIIENGMPPYLIHDERNSMNPFEASKDKLSPTELKTLEDLIKMGLTEYFHQVISKGGVPTDEDLLMEARKIVQKSDEFLLGPIDPEVSWFRDVIMLFGTTEEDTHDSPSALPWAKRLEKIAAQTPHKTIDLNTITCPKERALAAFMKSKQALGLTPTDRELQTECCRILDDTEHTANIKSAPAVAWFKYLITAESCWLREFRRRTGLPRSSEMASEHIRSTDDKTIDYSIHNHARLENELKEYTRLQISLGLPPSDADLQRQARLIVYNNDDPWNQTDIDNPLILHMFKRQNGLAPSDNDGVSNLDLPVLTEVHDTPSPRANNWDVSNLTSPSTNSPHSFRNYNAGSPPLLSSMSMNQPSTNTNPTQPLHYFLNDANCYGRLVRELSRFVEASMNPLNPNAHTPTDFEIQNQARMIIYSDPDPWNQTAADNAEWLVRFKRDVGLAPTEDGPGLPHSALSWRVAAGGSGFSPPYLCPKANLQAPQMAASTEEGVNVIVKNRNFSVSAKAASHFAQDLASGRWEKPGQVFCSRELETELQSFVKSELARGQWVSDEMLKLKAREILSVGEGTPTAADDQPLLEKFKMMVGLVQVGKGKTKGSNVGGDPTGVNGMWGDGFEDFAKAGTARPSGPCNGTWWDKYSNFDPAGVPAPCRPIGATSGVGFDAQAGAFDEGFLKDFDQELDGMDFSGLELPVSMFPGIEEHISGTERGNTFLTPIIPSPEARAQADTDMDMHSYLDGHPCYPAGLTEAQCGEPGRPSKLHSAVVVDEDDEVLAEGELEKKRKEYAEMYRVHSATASPLRRRASMRVAEKRGFVFPKSGAGVSGGMAGMDAVTDEDLSTF